MLHNGNRINGHLRSEESIKLLREHLIKFHKDKDENSLWCRFNELLCRIDDMEISHAATWNSFLNAAEELKKTKEKQMSKNDKNRTSREAKKPKKDKKAKKQAKVYE
jgi:hypothetical protein